MPFTQLHSRAAAIIATAGFLSAVGFAAATPAFAADISQDVIGDITITNVSTPGDTVHQYEKVRTDVVIDSKGKPVHEGDTFSVEFPTELEIATGGFDLLEGSIPLAHCDASTSANSVICTFNAEAAARQWIRGSISATATAIKTTTSHTVSYVVPGEIEPRPVPLPNGGGIEGPKTAPFPSEPYKRGWAWNDSQNHDKVAFTWEVNFANDENVTEFVIDDTVAAPQTLGTEYPEAFILKYYPAGTWGTDGAWTTVLNVGQTSLDYGNETYVVDLTVENPTHFTLHLPQFGENGGAFQLHYIATVPAATQSQTLKNTATLNNELVTTYDIEYESQFEGTIYGPGYGGFSLTKTVSGDGASLAGNDPFSIVLKWGDEDRVVELAAGATYTSAQIPTGTEVTISELATKTQTGYDFTPKFAASDGVSVSADGRTATFKIVEGKTLNVVLDNVFAAPTTTPATAPATSTPAVTPAPTTTQGSDLATTGAELPVWAMVLGAGALLAGSLLLTRRRSEQ